MPSCSPVLAGISPWRRRIITNRCRHIDCSVDAAIISGVWGDTVNLASHLESTGRPSRIDVSEPAYWRLRHRWEFEAREIDTLKGFGPTKTFLYSGRKVGELDNTVDLLARRTGQENLR